MKGHLNAFVELNKEHCITKLCFGYFSTANWTLLFQSQKETPFAFYCLFFQPIKLFAFLQKQKPGINKTSQPVIVRYDEENARFIVVLPLLNVKAFTNVADDFMNDGF